jgi:long-chain fatty acid transport protein
MRKVHRRWTLLALSALASLSATDAGLAAEGIALIGYGPRQKALAGADPADSRDAMSLSVNPAGIVGLERQFQIGITALLPERGYSAYGDLKLVAPGDIRSGRPIFPVPNSAYVSPIDADSAWGTVSYGNGGINTAYDFGHFKPPIFAPTRSILGGLFSSTPLVVGSLGGPFGGGFAGFDLEQAFISVGYAKRFGSISIGVAPTIAIQMMNAQGLKALSPYSSDPWHFTDNGYDWSYGGGVRAGLEWRAMPGLRFAVDASTPMFMSHFRKYQGLFADYGKLDIPAFIQAGVAYDVLPNLTVMAAWKHIFYSGIPALANPSFPIWPNSFGGSNGTGLSWRDTDMASFGAEWRATKDLTLRVGYAYATNPIPSYAVSLNVLAPAISAHHVSGGFGYQLTKNSSIDFAAVYAFKNSMSGPEADPYAQFAYAFNVPGNPIVAPVRVLPQYTNSNVTTWLRGLEISVGYNYKFDVGDASWIPTHF